MKIFFNVLFALIVAMKLQSQGFIMSWLWIIIFAIIGLILIAVFSLVSDEDFAKKVASRIYTARNRSELKKRNKEAEKIIKNAERGT